MNDSKISVRYSRALFESALEKKILDKVNEDMIFITEICKTQETKELIHNPVIVPSRKSAIFHMLLDGIVEPVTMSLIDLVVKNGRESFIPAIARVFITETMKYHGVKETVLTTAVPVSPELKKTISEMVSKAFNTKVKLKEQVDGKILGGFILRVDDNYIDGSLRKKLRTIEKGLKGSILE